MWAKKIIEWTWGKDLYQSIVFTWDLPLAKSQAIQWRARHKSGKIFIGGPVVKLLPEYITWGKILNETNFDVLSYHNPLATFTTRGCINKCSFCAVPRIEPKYKELKNYKIAPVICDNNFLASSKEHRISVYKKLQQANFKLVDFNQGLEAKLMTAWDAEWLLKLRVKIRFAFDSMKDEKNLKQAISICKKIGCKNFGVYVLIGFNDTPENALYRLEKIREWEILPTPMRFQPLDTLEKNRHINTSWDRHYMEKIMRYYSRLVYLEHIPFSEYKHAKKRRKSFKKKGLL